MQPVARAGRAEPRSGSPDSGGHYSNRSSSQQGRPHFKPWFSAVSWLFWGCFLRPRGPEVLSHIFTVAHLSAPGSATQRRGARALTPSLETYQAACICRDANTYICTQPVSAWWSEQPLGLTKTVFPEDGKSGIFPHVFHGQRSALILRLYLLELLAGRRCRCCTEERLRSRLPGCALPGTLPCTCPCCPLPSTHLMEAALLGRLPGTPVATSFPSLGARGHLPSRALRGARAENGITLASPWLPPGSL